MTIQNVAHKVIKSIATARRGRVERLLEELAVSYDSLAIPIEELLP